VQTRLSTGICQCKYTSGDLLPTQVCSQATPMHCSPAQGTMHSIQLNAAVQKRLMNGICQCKYTLKDLLPTQVCSQATPMHCSPAQDTMQPCSGYHAFHSAQCCRAKKADDRHMSVQIYLEGFTSNPIMQSGNTNALQPSSGYNAFHSARCCCAKKADDRHMSMQIYFGGLASHTSMQSVITNALQSSSGYHAFCTSAALQPKLETALFETALTPVRFCSFDQHCCTDTRTEPLCMLLLPCSPSWKQP